VKGGTHFGEDTAREKQTVAAESRGLDQVGTEWQEEGGNIHKNWTRGLETGRLTGLVNRT
jgi:hypothetical protein